MKKTFRGFTLIELAIVVFSISVLTGILVPNLQNYITQAEKATDYANGALLYDNIALIIASDDDAYFSFYNINDGGASRSAQMPELKTTWVDIDGDGKKEEVEYWHKGSKQTQIITRCSGVDASTAYLLAKKQNMGYDSDSSKYGDKWSGLHDPWYNTAQKGKNVLYTWEPVSSKNCGNLDSKNSSMNRATLSKRVKNGEEYGEYFVMQLSVKMSMPVWGDKYYGGNESGDGNPKNGNVDYSKSHFKMRYTKGQPRAEGYKNTYASNDYAWEWMIAYDPESYDPIIYAGNGQTNLVRQIYPDVSAETVLDW
jgi:type II secretory pathway pseudopilin PulG